MPNKRSERWLTLGVDNTRKWYTDDKVRGLDVNHID